jgi:hypothetical protein
MTSSRCAVAGAEPEREIPRIPFAQVSNLSIDEPNYDDRDVENSMDKIDTLDYHQVGASPAPPFSP